MKVNTYAVAILAAFAAVAPIVDAKKHAAAESHEPTDAAASSTNVGLRGQEQQHEQQRELHPLCTTCHTSNPCTHPGQYFTHCDPAKFIQCGQHYQGSFQCFDMPCAPGTKWSQAALTCVHATSSVTHPTGGPWTSSPPHTPTPPACGMCQDLCADLPHHKHTIPCVAFDAVEKENYIEGKFVECSGSHSHWGDSVRYCTAERSCGDSEFYKECYDSFKGLVTAKCVSSSPPGNRFCSGDYNVRITPLP